MKKVLAILLVLCMVLGLAACGGGGNNTTPQNNTADDKPLAGTYDIRVWCDTKVIDLTKKQIEAFNNSNDQGIKFNATVDPMSESEAATQMITDIEAGADLFFFAQDQLVRLIQANGLLKLGDSASAFVRENNDAASVGAASADNVLYAYPVTADNGYFMYYDKSVIPEADLDSMEKLIADCEAAKKYFAFEVGGQGDGGSGWYAASFFFATGCRSDWQMNDEGKYIGVVDSFNSPEGLIAAKGMYKLVSSDFYLNASNADAFANGAAVVVTGTWAYSDIEKMLGANMGVTDLPSFNVDGKDYHLYNFNGFKLVGIKPQTDAKKGAALQLLAQYLTGKDCQLERFNEVAWGPSNKEAQQNEAVKKNAALVALNKQNEFSIPQGQISDSWWNIAKVIAADVKASGGTDEGLQKALDNYKAAIDELFALDTSGFIFVGAWNGWNNADNALRMKESGGVYTITVEVPQSDYMGGRIVTPGEWDNDKGYAQVTTGKDLMDPDMADPAKNGDNNIVFAAPGTYTVTYNSSNGEVTITK